MGDFTSALGMIYWTIMIMVTITSVLGNGFIVFIVSIWCNTWLNVFYCVKVTNFLSRPFLWVKTRINVLTLKLLGMSIVVSLIFSLPSAISYYDQKKWCNRTGRQTLNASQSKVCKDINTVFLLPQLCVFTINFIMNITASVLLLSSLWRHTRNLRNSGIGVKDLNTRGHVNCMAKHIFSNKDTLL
uniref:Taste receptor type 2 member 40 n=1 Tax=Pogona vitticeps TaxID=103695 RepID=A0ABM5FCR4_9SAUR